MVTREFVSYATDYEMYVGRKDWTDLSIADQDRIINCMTSAEGNIEALVMSLDWKRRQEMGFGWLFVACSSMLERGGNIEAADWGDAHRHNLWTLLSDTPVGHRLSEAWYPEEYKDRTPLDPKVLEWLALDSRREDPLADLLHMDWSAAETLLERVLGRVERPPAPTKARDVIEKTWSELSSAERNLMVDAASVGNEDALTALERALPALSGIIRLRVQAILWRRGTWRARWARKLAVPL
ncbi:hypothetical protein SAMN05216360_101381 [Methylobacterium phyllostachyos]|uniref:Uncharacterized protein n=1 Tax=Methylobacterium phyllostachyos TaxID=582672 RepID=A0A1G9RU14_9HYPH|nr:hypothetical protein [Methylobacterium phyllostachyos]SDM26768.1 hypothetical protein SAMN05216360_101381 [Methylobacterium phyllostachyos]